MLRGGPYDGVIMGDVHIHGELRVNQVLSLVQEHADDHDKAVAVYRWFRAVELDEMTVVIYRFDRMELIS